MVKGWEAKFLDVLGKCGIVTVAAEYAGVSPSTAYRLRSCSNRFKAAWLIARGKFYMSAREKGVRGKIRCPDCGCFLAFDDDTWYCSRGDCDNKLSYDLKNGSLQSP